MKNILFGSVVAAALIFSGCGSSSSSSSDSNTSTGGTTGGDTTGGDTTGGDTTGGDTTGDDTTGGDTTGGTTGGITIGGKTWTPLIAQNDANRSISGKQTQTNAVLKCPTGTTLPSQSDINESVAAELLANTDFKKDANLSTNTNTGDKFVYIWVKEDNRKYYLNDTNSSDSAAMDADITDEEYYTCVKAN
jgi:hypothetical protein